MKARSTLLLTACVVIGTIASAQPHAKSFWQSIARAQYAVPTNESPFALAKELSGFLGSPDPELRDELAFSILSAWLTGGASFTENELAVLQKDWLANLRSDAVLKRSFSALCLASLAERDLKTPFLEADRYRELLDSALAYLASERDLRGYDPQTGWIHATAHTADLLAALARNPRLTPADQRNVLAAIARRLSTAGEVFTQGEQDRLAQAVAAIVSRSDFDGAAFEAWLIELRASRRQAARTRPLTSAALATHQNDTYFLQALHVRLSAEPLDGASEKARTAVLDVLRPR
jgi:hypothetical protein